MWKAPFSFMEEVALTGSVTVELKHAVISGYSCWKLMSKDVQKEKIKGVTVNRYTLFKLFTWHLHGEVQPYNGTLEFLSLYDLW